eukprot:1573530-Pleurochrysis_carterae.AAC.1
MRVAPCSLSDSPAQIFLSQLPTYLLLALLPTSLLFAVTFPSFLRGVGNCEMSQLTHFVVRSEGSVADSKLSQQFPQVKLSDYRHIEYIMPEECAAGPPALPTTAPTQKPLTPKWKKPTTPKRSKPTTPKW